MTQNKELLAVSRAAYARGVAGGRFLRAWIFALAHVSKRE